MIFVGVVYLHGVYGSGKTWKVRELKIGQGIRVSGQGKFLSEDIKNMLLFISHFIITKFFARAFGART